MQYGPSLVRDRDYEPGLSIAYYGIMYLLMRSSLLPIVKRLMEVWKGNLLGDEDDDLPNNRPDANNDEDDFDDNDSDFNDSDIGHDGSDYGVGSDDEKDESGGIDS